MKNTSDLSFAQLERLLIESIKSMVLEGSDQLTSKFVSAELKHMKDMAAATVRHRSKKT